MQTPDVRQREGRDGLRTATFLISPEEDCTLEVHVALRGVATRTGPRTQVRSATRGGSAFFGEGDGRAGPWRVARMSNDTLYAVASKRIANRRYAQVRAPGFPSGNCKDATLREIGAQLAKLVHRARVDVRVGEPRQQPARPSS